jgi:hypothetical protein
MMHNEMAMLMHLIPNNVSLSLSPSLSLSLSHIASSLYFTLYPPGAVKWDNGRSRFQGEAASREAEDGSTHFVLA